MLSRHRSKESANRIPERLKNKAVTLMINEHPDFGPTFVQEKLQKLHGISVSRNYISSRTYRDTFHAIARKAERNITLPEIIHVLTTGRHEKSKDYLEEAFNSWNYAIRGKTIDRL